ncbi:hypothetical protein PIB30_038151 [Stylosanthes scabra]|uniref:Uncharacterized protein n=1 Tax=Stylosanthes scabra TaxID=79078 RepID=A0ABU6WC90_9FABA|nr:hypothetical protein [Stylosanthes scabra]
MAVLETNTKISLHLRNNSLPSAQHPFGSQCEELCQRLKDSEATSCSSSCSISKNLDGLQDLHECIHNLLQLPNSQQALAGECIRELLDGSLRLLDIFSMVQDCLVQSRETVCELESVIRRRRSKAENGISIEVGRYIASRKQIKKAIIQKALTNLKGFKKDHTVASSSNAALKTLMNHKPSSVENLHSHMENLELCIQDLEAGVERLSRQLIRTRVSLLNIFSY